MCPSTVGRPFEMRPLPPSPSELDPSTDCPPIGREMSGSSATYLESLLKKKSWKLFLIGEVAEKNNQKTKIFSFHKLFEESGK
jgi:hypothetical protein